MQTDKQARYSIPETLPENTFAYSGTWTVGKERSMAQANGALELKFGGKQVFLVMNTVEGKTGRVRIYLNEEVVTTEAGKDVVDGIVTVDSDRLYELISLPDAGKYELKMEFLDSNVEVFAFTFG
jgi:hypothetical protein